MPKHNGCLTLCNAKWMKLDGKCGSSIYSSFRQQAIQKEITKLQDVDGNIHTDWADIVDIAKGHFEELFGTDVNLSEEDLEVLLSQQTNKIPIVARECLEKLIKLKELLATALIMAKNKVPGNDGILVEFFLVF